MDTNIYSRPAGTNRQTTATTAMMKPGEDFEVLVQRPAPPSTLIRARPYYRRWSPWIVSAAALACVVLFLVTMYVNDCHGHRSAGCAASFLGRFAFQPLKENPLLGPSSATLLKMGALDVSKVVHGRQGWRLITCMWLHAGVVHLLINMLCLVFIGIRLEQEFGFVRIGLVYLISGFGGSLMSALFIRSSISVGASGALFGLIGSMLSELITNWSLYANKVAALLTLVFVIVVNLAVGILPRVDNFAHIGGLISGFLLGFVFFIRPQFAWLNQTRESPGQQTPPVKRKHNTYQYMLWLAAAVLLIVGFTVAIVLLFRGYNANEHCSWCHYLSCVPTKKWKCNSSPTICTVPRAMGRYSPAYHSPPRRGYGGRGRSPPRRGYGGGRGRGGRGDQGSVSLLVRNIPIRCSAEELRAPFERFGPVRDVYLPRDYYTGDQRGFGFVEFVDASDASEAQYHMNRKMLLGREITVVLAADSRKRPEEMRKRTNPRGYSDHEGRRSSRHGVRSRSRSYSRSRSPRPRGRARSRSYSCPKKAG